MYSTHNEKKSVVAETFVTTLNKKIYKYITWILKNVHIDKLDGIVNIYNNTHDRTINMGLVDVKPNIYIDFNKGNNKEGSKFEVGNHVRISRYKNIFANVTFQIG